MRTISLSVLLAVSACAARQTPPPSAPEVVTMDGVRIVAKHDEQGGYTFESYDAEDLFKRGNVELDAGRCPEAVLLYDRVASEFPGGRYASASLYNAGLCLAQRGQNDAALEHFSRLLSQLSDSPDVKHASFQVGHLLITLARWDDALARAGELLAQDDLDGPERMEVMAMRAQALLGKGDLAAAEKQAQESLTFYRTRAAELAADPYYAAAANYVVAECIRLRAEALSFPETSQDEQKVILNKRAQLLLDAMREYANTITHTSAIIQTNPKWAAASGYRIGAMYDKLWHDLMSAPVPPTLSEGAKEVYPKELAKLIKPLLRHAIRYWELTLMMAERTGAQGEWVEKTRGDLERTRALMLDQPPGPGGLPPRQTEAPPPEAQVPDKTSAKPRATPEAR
jgi:outer membrane protein assembly factor BamD (BamD/ComL family)